MSFLKDESVIAGLILKYPKRDGADGIKKRSNIFPVESYPGRS